MIRRLLRAALIHITGRWPWCLTRFDNTADYEPARLNFRCTDGKVEKRYGPLPGWAKPIWTALAKK
jgi:hypothetical protein